MSAMANDKPTCPSCGEPAETASARFCENCGRPFPGAAPAPSAKVAGGCRCGSPEPDEDGFCANCGTRIVDHAPATPTLPGYEEAVGPSLALACDMGRRHPTNQDNGAVALREDGTSLLVVCDGVSTSENAEEASRAAAHAARDAFLSGPGSLPGMSLEDQAMACARRAQDAVRRVETMSSDPDGGAATTIVLAVMRGRVASLAWAGDSRAYVVTPGVPEEQVTVDDSWCRQVVDSGRMSYEAALRDPNAHAITQWLGMDPAELALRTRTVPVPPLASLLLCSDGLWNYADGKGRMGEAYASAAAGAGGDNAETCRRLVAFANAAGGRDNITVAVATPSP